MKVVIVGANGAIGSAVAKAVAEKNHEVIPIARSTGEHRADIGDPDSLAAVFKQIGAFDAVANAAGSVEFGAFEQLTDAQWAASFASKLMGQVHLVRAALPYISDHGSFTLVSGILSDEPIAGGAIATTVNHAIEGFTRAAAVELPRGLRINCISPTVLTESMPAYAPFFPGFVPVDAWRVGQAYVRAILGIVTGRVLKV